MKKKTILPIFQGLMIFLSLVNVSLAESSDPYRVFKKNPSHFELLTPICGAYQEGGPVCVLNGSTEELIEKGRESFLKDSELRRNAFEVELENVDKTIDKLKKLADSYDEKSDFLKSLYLTGAKELTNSDYRLSLVEGINENGPDSELLKNLDLLSLIFRKYKDYNCDQELEGHCKSLVREYSNALSLVNILQDVAYTNFRMLDYPVLKNAEILSKESHFDHKLRNPFLELKLYWPKGQALHSASVYLIEDAKLIEKMILDDKGNHHPITIQELKSGIWSPKMVFNKKERRIIHKYGLDPFGNVLPFKNGWKEYLELNL
jgi:hypothetical protein